MTTHEEAGLIRSILAEPITPQNERAHEALTDALFELEQAVAYDLVTDPELVCDFYLLMARAREAYFKRHAQVAQLASEDPAARNIIEASKSLRLVLKRIAQKDEFPERAGLLKLDFEHDAQGVERTVKIVMPAVAR